MANETTFSIGINVKTTKTKIADFLKSKGYEIDDKNNFVLIEEEDGINNLEIVRFFDDYINEKFLTFILEQ